MEWYTITQLQFKEANAGQIKWNDLHLLEKLIPLCHNLAIPWIPIASLKEPHLVHAIIPGYIKKVRIYLNYTVYSVNNVTLFDKFTYLVSKTYTVVSTCPIFEWQGSRNFFIVKCQNYKRQAAGHNPMVSPVSLFNRQTSVLWDWY